jgi:hypothetical protein
MKLRTVLLGSIVGVLLVVGCSAIPAPGGPTAQHEEPPGLQPRSRSNISFKQPFAIEWDRGRDRDRLALLDPRSLTTGRSVPIGGQGNHRFALSPDDEHLVVAARGGRIRVIDTALVRLVREHSFERTGWPVALRWIDSSRVLLVSGARLETRVTVFDPFSGEVEHRSSFEGTSVRVRRAAEGVVALIKRDAMRGEHLPAQLAVIGPDGKVFRVMLERIVAGFAAGAEERFGNSLAPALATQGNRAVVIGTDGTVAVVNLDSLEVDYPETSLSFADRLSAALLPTAQAKFSEGTSLWARWIDDRYLAVTGSRTDMRGRGDDLRMQSRCLPPRLLDTHDWSLFDWNGTGNGLKVIDGAILTYDRCADEEEPPGLTAYTGNGDVLWRALRRKNISGVTVRAGLAFVRHGYERVLRSVIDIRNGRVLTTRESFASILPY